MVVDVLIGTFAAFPGSFWGGRVVASCRLRGAPFTGCAGAVPPGCNTGVTQVQNVKSDGGNS